MNEQGLVTARRSLPTGRERRRAPRFAVRLGAHVRDASGEKNLSVTETWTVGLSTGGACIEWPRCKPCTGYQVGSIHPLCVLKPFDNRLCSSRELSLCFDLPDGRQIAARGKVVYVLRPQGQPTEQLGIQFTAFDGDGQASLAEALRTAKKVLVVDNGVAVGDQLTWRISGSGMAAVCAADCDEAVQQIQLDPFDLIVAAVGTPGIEAAYTVGRLRAAAPLVPVILVAAQGAVQPGEHLDCFGVLVEPFSPERLELMIQQALGGRADGDPVAA